LSLRQMKNSPRLLICSQERSEQADGKIKNLLILVALMGGVAYVAYTYVLNDEAKESVKGATKAIERAYGKLAEMADAAKGQVMEDDQPLANVQATARQWKNLGF